MSKCKNSHQAIIADEQIIKLYWQREERAIQATDNKYGKFLYRIAYNILHDHGDSEECQNDTYLDIWNAIPPTKPKVFPAFISQIMRRIALDRYKFKTSKKRIPSELTVCLDDLRETLYSYESIDNELVAQELGRIINNFVLGLTARQRYIFVERFYLSESIETIAADLAVSIPTIYREINKIKLDLKLYLERNKVYK